ncbi:MAG: MFS transporter [Candidatus Nanopelagicales bacterium]|nr:MFS transporter [Candidatus Nanopelagicales bacterium]
MGELRDSTPQVKRFLAGALLNSLGSGLTLPILIVYLNQVRGFSLTAASLILSWMAITGLAFSPISGHLVDKFGPRRIMLIAILIEAVATVSWAFVNSITDALLVGALSSLGHAAIWPTQTTMMARMVNKEFRAKFFGLQFMMLNLGLGLGGIFSSLIVSVDDPASFTRLYVLDAMTYLIFFGFIYTLRGIGDQIEKPQAEIDNDGGYRQVLADHIFMRLAVAKLLLVTFGYASLDAGLPTLLTLYGDLSVKALGPIWAVNTGVIVLGQIFVINRLEGRSRVRLMFGISLIWSVAWIIIGLSVSLDPKATFALAAIGVGIFALGEMIWSSVGPTLTNELAPEHMRGRYNSVDGLIWVFAGAIGPALSGIMLQFELIAIWIGIIVTGQLVAGLLVLRIRHVLTPTQDGRIGDT